jgi:hypothetical protein
MNEYKWNPSKNTYTKFNLVNDKYCVKFTTSNVNFDVSMDEKKYILTILCKILNSNETRNGDIYNIYNIFDKFYGLGYEDTKREISYYLLQKIGLTSRVLDDFVSLQQNTNLDKSQVIKRMLCRLNAINLDITNNTTNYDASNEPEFPRRQR